MLDVYLDIACETCEKQTLLIVGEGNFSFARYLVENKNQNFPIIVYATSLDDEKKIYANENAKNNTDFLQTNDGVYVLHGVDATQLSKHFSNRKFCSIVFNFPHVGGKSNIKECQRLLNNFFASASEHLCDSGKIVMPLCRGQGGTPADHPRRLYKNSWMVASQAANSGLVLADALAFDHGAMLYSQAGYRGMLRKQFLTEGGFIHVFKKGNVLTAHNKPIYIDYLCDVSSNMAVTLFSHFAQTITSVFGNLYKEIRFTPLDPIMDVMQADKIEKVLESSAASYDNFQLTYFVQNNATKILPYTYPINQHIVFAQKITESRSFEEITNEILNKLQKILYNSTIEIYRCDCKNGFSGSCSCLPNHIICDSSSHGNDESRHNDNDVPNFITDLKPTFWKHQHPEVTISYHNDNDETLYKNCKCVDYELSGTEKGYFETDCNQVNIGNPDVVKKVTVNNICIVNVRRFHSNVLLTFNSNEFLHACYGVNDVRYLWCEDKQFQRHFIQILEEDLANERLCPGPVSWHTLILHPLCYRHDLCLWVDSEHTEKQLISVIRSVCMNLIHSVRLLKVLRHEETSCVSYCYRMIYSRIDGPLSHRQTVDIQNKLRRNLLDLGFQLR